MELTLKKISECLNLSKRTVQRMALSQKWPFSGKSERGHQRLFNIAQLPREIARKVQIHINGKAAELFFAERSALAQYAKQAEEERLEKAKSALERISQPQMPGQKKRFDGRFEIVKGYEEWLRKNPMKKCESFYAFAKAFNAHEAMQNADVRKVYPELTGRTLGEWYRKFEKQGHVGLLDNWTSHHLKSVNVFTKQPHLESAVLSIITSKPHIKTQDLVDLLAHHAIDKETGEILYEAPSYHATNRFVNAWKKKNEQLFVAISNPDQFKNEFMPAFGSYSENVIRLNQIWEMDSTPADWMLKTEDGTLKRFNVSGVIDVYSRRALIVISPTPKTETHKLLLRLALLKWGIPEIIKTDNGADYISKEFVRTLDSLEIQHQRTERFSPEQKPHIERMNHTMMHSIIELHDSFIGHNVAERKAIEARKSFAERLFKKGEVVEMAMPYQELQERLNKWLFGVYEQREHAELNMSPFQKAANYTGKVARIENERALDLLLAQPAGKGSYVVSKKGLKIEKAQFIHPELSLFIGQLVQVRLTEDMGEIVVYQEDKFICIARCPERTGISRQAIAVEAKKLQRKTLIEKKKALRSNKIEVSQVVDSYLDKKAREAGKVVMLTKPSSTFSNQALDEAAKAARVADGITRELSEDEKLTESIKKKSDEWAMLQAERIKAEQSKAKNLPSNVKALEESAEMRFAKWEVLKKEFEEKGTIQNADENRFFNRYIYSTEFLHQMERRKKLNSMTVEEMRRTEATILRIKKAQKA